MNEILIKHIDSADAQDCLIRWSVNYAKMLITLQVDFISPSSLRSFLQTLHEHDEQFAKTNITGTVNITKSFDVRLELPNGAVFQVRTYQPFSITGSPAPVELEFFCDADTKSEHVTPVGGNIFEDLGFPPAVAAKLLAETDRAIDAG